MSARGVHAQLIVLLSHTSRMVAERAVTPYGSHGRYIMTTTDELMSEIGQSRSKLGDGSHRQTHSGCEDQAVLERWWKEVQAQ